MPTCCPSPVCVHYWVSTQPGPPSGVQVSSRPVSSPSSVRLSGSLVRTRLSGRLVSSPSGVQPSGVCPSARSQPSRPASAGWWRWGRPRYGGQRSRLDRVEFHVVRPRPRAARSTARGAWMRAPLRSRVQAGGGASAADLGRVVLRREAAPERPGRPDRRGGRLSLRLRSGRGGWRDLAARHRAGRPSVSIPTGDLAARSGPRQGVGPDPPPEAGMGAGPRHSAGLS
jgi:hypothetical protein